MELFSIRIRRTFQLVSTHIIPTSTEKTVETFVHKAVKRDIFGGGFQELINRIKNTVIYIIARKGTTGIYKYPAFSSFRPFPKIFWRV